MFVNLKCFIIQKIAHKKEMIKLLWAISFFKNINKNKQLWKGYQNKDALAKRIKTFKVNFLAIL